MDTKGSSSEKIKETPSDVGSVEQNGTTSSIVLSEYGLHRGLKSHHIQLLAISGVIGTGLFVGTSSVLNSAGPARLLIGYSIWCIFLLCVAHAMGEMSAFLPVPGSIVTPLTGLWSYWFPDINPGVWVAVTLVVVFGLNCLAVKYFGEAEFYASILKVFLIIGFLLFTFIVVLGGNPEHDRIGFRYWKNPGAFNEQYVEGGPGRFLAIWGVFITAAFAIEGPDFIANCAPEALNPRRNIPKAVRLSANASGNGVAKSPFIIAMNRLEISFLPDLCNAVVTIFGLAKNGRAPKIFARLTKSGVPMPALILSTAVASLAFLTCNTASAVVLNWFINLGSTAIMIACILMMVANLRFHKGLKVQGIDTSTLPFKSKFTPYSNYFAIFWVSLLLLTNGYGVFINGHWSFSGFFTAYFAIFFFLIIYFGWKIVKRTSFIKAEDMDFHTGLAEVEAHENQLTFKAPSPRYERIMGWLW
ncbi:hypothetical protein QQZ08_011681 [Neonectria magnoliae]|uniref:Amino acid permease/ SLC12A domain-containing protein n=1 Tax=Neonectria magnoliae TaxID=2732573 RepID=A0ABR1H9Q9_9HYPO